MDKQYVVFAMYSRRETSCFLRIDATDLLEAIGEAWYYQAPNLLLMDQHGHQYVIRVKGRNKSGGLY